MSGLPLMFVKGSWTKQGNNNQCRFSPAESVGWLQGHHHLVPMWVKIQQTQFWWCVLHWISPEKQQIFIKGGSFGDVDCRKSSPKLKKLHRVMPNHSAHSNHTLQVAGLCLSWSNDQLEYQSQQKHTANATLQQKLHLLTFGVEYAKVIRFSFSGFPNKPRWTPIPCTHTYTKAPKIHNPTHA